MMIICQFSIGNLRRTKRHITQEVKEWDEEMEDGCDDKGDAAPELDWGFMDGSEHQDNKPVPGH